jgi:hypothetical protein
MEIGSLGNCSEYSTVLLNIKSVFKEFDIVYSVMLKIWKVNRVSEMG